MDFDYSPKTKDLQVRLQAFMAEHVYPAEGAYHGEIEANSAAGKRWTPLQTIEQLKPKAQAAGLWNLFLPVDSAAASGCKTFWAKTFWALRFSSRRSPAKP